MVVLFAVSTVLPDRVKTGVADADLLDKHSWSTSGNERYSKQGHSLSVWNKRCKLEYFTGSKVLGEVAGGPRSGMGKLTFFSHLHAFNDG